MKWFKKNSKIFLICIGILILIKITEWVLNDLITFRFESGTLNDLMFAVIGMSVFFGLPWLLADVYDKWVFLDKLYLEDRRKIELEKAEHIKETEGFKST